MKTTEQRRLPLAPASSLSDISYTVQARLPKHSAAHSALLYQIAIRKMPHSQATNQPDLGNSSIEVSPFQVTLALCQADSRS